MNRQERSDLDAYLTRIPDEEPMWCGRCDVPESECIDPDAHAGEWILVRERERDEALDNLHINRNTENR